MEISGITNSGKVRKSNQDSYDFYINHDMKLASVVVCDGMGGANSGNIASSLAAHAFILNIKNNISPVYDQHGIESLIIESIFESNSVVFDKSLSEEEHFGMGTTLIAAVVSENACVVANIGDSRLYHISGDNMTLITKDHSVVEEMVDNGEISGEEARFHPSRNLITRALGTSAYVPPDIFFVNLSAGDCLLLCSDGLSNVVTEDEILNEFSADKSAQDICNDLISASLSHGAPDNVTVVILRK